jgi:hypothetical protein
VLAFHSWDQSTCKNNLKRNIIYFGSAFPKFQSMVAWSHALWQNIMAAGKFGRAPSPRGQEADREEVKEDQA